MRSDALSASKFTWIRHALTSSTVTGDAGLGALQKYTRASALQMHAVTSQPVTTAGLSSKLLRDGPTRFASARTKICQVAVRGV